jgi:hypothetical protein
MMSWTAKTELRGDMYKPRINRKRAMIEKIRSVKSIEWIMNLLVFTFSRVIPRNPLMKHPTKQIEAEPVIMAEMRKTMGSIGLFQKGLAVITPRSTPV